ncbi:MAG: transporter [Rhodomicrobium sp.]
MRALKTAMTAVAFSTLAFASGASAGSLEPPGWTAGLALGGALPEGAYFIDNASIGGWRGIDDSKSSLVINVPLIAWSTPWTIAGARVEVLATVPEISGGVPYVGPSWSGRDYTQVYNPAGFVGAAWDLGGGFGFSAFIGGWAPVDNQLGQFGFDSGALSERVNLSYVANGWKLAANLSFGQAGKSDVYTVLSPTDKQVLPDWFNYDLTATKTIGKWEIGLVGFGSSDTSKGLWTASGGKEQSQFALGGLVGYSFPGITLQTYVTTDVATSNYTNLSDGSKSYETRVWSRAIVPLWNPPALESYK